MFFVRQVACYTIYISYHLFIETQCGECKSCVMRILMIQEKIEKANADKLALEEDRKGFQYDIEKWEKEFKERTGKEPTEEDQ